jgi:myo-inositol-1(or 4)-monophosphatase
MSLAPADLFSVLATLNAAADAVEEALSRLTRPEGWGLTGGSPGQYGHDLVADAAALGVLDAAGFGVFSEESGVHNGERPVFVVLDPVDGSTNASRGLPWWAVSLCALDSLGPAAAVVASPVLHTRFEAVRGAGAKRNGVPISPSGAEDIGRSVVAFNGYPRSYYGWSQYRALGSASLELCLVACGALDGFVDCSVGALAPWDYLGGMLVCLEAGAQVKDAFGRDLVVRRPGERRAVIAAPSASLLDKLVAMRQLQGGQPR